MRCALVRKALKDAGEGERLGELGVGVVELAALARERGALAEELDAAGDRGAFADC